MIENDLDGLADGKLGCSANDGRATMKEVQKFTIEGSVAKPEVG